jgi:hypothetical protein
MAKKTRTPWFPVRDQPVRPGIYEYTGFMIPVVKAHWSGDEWTIPHGKGPYFSSMVTDRWRGLTEEHK